MREREREQVSLCLCLFVSLNSSNGLSNVTVPCICLAFTASRERCCFPLRVEMVKITKG